MYIVVKSFGFQNPVTLVAIAAYNVAALLYLVLITALVAPFLRKNAWKIALIIVLSWFSVGLLFFVVISEESPVLAIKIMLPHGWLETFMVFYWVNSIRVACFNLSDSPVDMEAYSFKDYILLMNKPVEMFYLAKKEIFQLLVLAKYFFGSLWSSFLKKKFLVVVFLAVISAFIETYVTPLIAGF